MLLDALRLSNLLRTGLQLASWDLTRRRSNVPLRVIHLSPPWIMRVNNFGQSAGIVGLASVLVACVAPLQARTPDMCDALPYSSVFLRFPIDQAKAQFRACTGPENQPFFALGSCPLLPVTPIFTALVTLPLIPLISMPMDLVSKLSPNMTCKAPAAGEAKEADISETR
jgi:hypothetical protein